MQTIQRSLRVNQAVVSAELDNETVLLNVETGIYFGLDEVGSQIWTLLLAGQEQQAIVAHLLDVYDAEPSVVQTDVAEFIESLTAKGILCLDD